MNIKFSPSLSLCFLLLLISARVRAGTTAFYHDRNELKKYFRRFGYLSDNDLDSEAQLKSAIKRYQKKLGLTINGKLDSPTMSEILSPRCGVPDIVHAPSLVAERYVFFLGKPRWRRNIPMTLTYAFSPTNMITSLSNVELRAAFRHAFSHWAAVVPVNFEESDYYDFADIKIGFYSGDHGDGEAFDGVLGVLAHAFSPESGRFHLDAAETWAVDVGAATEETAVDLESVATHEIGHLLGLGHSEVKEAVMYPSLRPKQRKVELMSDDIKGVQALYGSNPNFSFYESDVSSDGGSDWRLRSQKLLFIIFNTWICFLY